MRALLIILFFLLSSCNQNKITQCIFGSKSPIQGTIDNQWGSQGRSQVFTTTSNDYESSIGALNVSGQVVGVTKYNESTRLFRLDCSGNLDSSFLAQPITVGASSDTPTSLVVQSDDKILVAGWTSTGGGSHSWYLVRYHSNGVLDNTFGTQGKVILTSWMNKMDRLFRIHVLDDGKILALGTHLNSASDGFITVARLTSAGVLDPTFGSSGFFRTNLNPGSIMGEYAIFAKALPDGSILVGGTTVAAGVLLKLTSSGTLDTTFATNGVFSDSYPSFNTKVFGIHVYSDGKILLSGVKGGDDLAFWKLLPSGALDASFGTNGKYIHSISVDHYFQDLVVEDNGKILIAAQLSSTKTLTAVLRFNSDGTLDSTFANSGYSVFNTDATGEYLTGTALQKDGKMLLMGYATYPTQDQFYIYRLK